MSKTMKQGSKVYGRIAGGTFTVSQTGSYKGTRMVRLSNFYTGVDLGWALASAYAVFAN